MAFSVVFVDIGRMQVVFLDIGRMQKIKESLETSAWIRTTAESSKVPTTSCPNYYGAFVHICSNSPKSSTEERNWFLDVVILEN